jgi:hypothetical protein
MNIDPRKPVTAITLVDCFEAHCPDDVRKGIWDEADTRHDRTSLFRLRQLKALFSAFEIRFDPERFEQGWFIVEKREKYQGMVARLTSQLPKPPSQPPKVRDLWRLFPVLRTYHREVEAARHCYRRHKRFPPFVDLVVREAIVPASALISVAISPISGLLAELIAPDGRTFLLEDLIRDHGHPAGNYLELQQEEEDEFWRALFEEDINDFET